MTRPKRATTPVPLSDLNEMCWPKYGVIFMTDKDRAFFKVIDLMASEARPRFRDRLDMLYSKVCRCQSNWGINQHYIREYAAIGSKRGVLSCAAELHLDLEKVEAYYTLIHG